MPAENKIIKLNSISRHTVDNQPCIVLDNQQDSLSQVHRLALKPAVEKLKPDGSKVISFPNGGFQVLNAVKIGQFPICFPMQTQYGYLVLAIVSQNVIPDFSNQGHFASAGTSALNGSTEFDAEYDIERDHQMACEWIATHKKWVQTNGILIYA